MLDAYGPFLGLAMEPLTGEANQTTLNVNQPIDRERVAFVELSPYAKGAHRTPCARHENSWPNDDAMMRWADEPEDTSVSPHQDDCLKEYKGGLDRPVFWAGTRISDAVRMSLCTGLPRLSGWMRVPG